jgi:16S rRNA (guanine1207-N2)-methyltransferase
MTEHYFARRPAAPSRPVELRAQLRGRQFQFHSDAGVFSATRIDRGTSLLAEVMEVRATDRVLDLGCGYGVLGIVAAALAPQGMAVLIDRNARAAQLAHHNVALNGVANAYVVVGEGANAVGDGALDVVVTNPPVHAGNAAVFAFIAGAHRVLRPGGRLFFVGRKSRGALSFARHAQELFGNAAEVARKWGYRIYAALRE